jgi:hypothetical protein
LGHYRGGAIGFVIAGIIGKYTAAQADSKVEK